jgi:DNA-binding CsgD family transcriptional regulator
MTGVVVRLSELELAVLDGLISGLVSKEIAVRTGRSKATIDAYVRILCAKFEAKSRAQLAALAVSRGTVKLEIE